MNYAYLFVDNLDGHSYQNGLEELKASIFSLKKIQNYNSIHVFNNETSGKNIEYFQKENVIHNHINLSRNYGSSNNINPINILVEKIICLMNFDENKDITLIDIDTEFQRSIPNVFWNPNYVVFDNVEYPIMAWRNLDKILPNIPWKTFDINFDSSFLMYNTGVIHLPKKFRREICEKALQIVDYLNHNFSPEDRCGNKLDEQIALSIVCHDIYGRFGKIKYSKDYIKHHWESKHTEDKWWKKYNLLSEESKYETFISMHSQSCLNLISNYESNLKDKVIIDVGSNIGLFAKSIAENIPYNHIHLFEPCTEYSNKSKTLLKDFKNITYNNVALGDCEEEKTLYKCKDSNIGWNTLYDKDPNQNQTFFEEMDSEIVTTVRLDDYYKDIEQLDFIKIDVEGYERNVLEGSWNLIKKFKPHILIEVGWGVNHPDWQLNKKTYEKLFSLGYEKIDLDSIHSTSDILFKPIVKNEVNPSKVTLVTGLWNAGRDQLDGIWNRSFDFYLERFLELLKTDNNLIIFGDENLKKIVFEHRSEENTQFILKDLAWFKTTDYYPLIQKVRNDPKWKYQNDWIKDCPLGAMEMAIPIYLSKMIFLNEAIEKSKFNSDYFYHVDGGTRMNKDNFSKKIVEELSNYSDFFFVCFPYVGKDIHGFDYEKVKELTSDSIETVDMVPRGTFFGGHKNNIKKLYPLYYNLMMDTLNQGFMGLDESLFTILTYKYPNLIDYHRLDEIDNGDPEVFFDKFNKSENKSDLFANKRKISVVQIGTNHAYDDLSNYLISNYKDNHIDLILLVEPNRFHNPSIKKCYEKYSNVIIENIAVKPSTNDNIKMTLFYRDFVGGNFEVASSSLEHVSKHDYVNGNINSFEVSCLSLEELLDKYSIKTLDWLLLDIEGIDSEVILNFDWEKYDIKKVEFEHLHLGEKKQIIKQKFLDMGYHQVNSLHEFDWAFVK